MMAKWHCPNCQCVTLKIKVCQVEKYLRKLEHELERQEAWMLEDGYGEMFPTLKEAFRELKEYLLDNDQLYLVKCEALGEWEAAE